MARWKILLSKFDIIYVSQKAMKGSTIVDFLASRAPEDYDPLNFDFPSEEIMYVAATEKDTTKDHIWKLNFDRALNDVEYEACIMGLRVAIERKIRALEVYEDSALVIYQLRDKRFQIDQLSKMADALTTLASMIKVSKQKNIKPIRMSVYEAPSHCSNMEKAEMTTLGINIYCDM
ncbi:uncharacterized protein LOC128286794 [Gossypium arboreum]|uniref:uncharacterized protein LOC128286794 n=1 Tax=Gossypium arboreum TaxID=29729 RepID=UPI0022F1C1E2|nr:uncharacterized protein LOC128286794 [Gossypium arboreum]